MRLSRWQEDSRGHRGIFEKQQIRHIFSFQAHQLRHSALRTMQVVRRSVPPEEGSRRGEILGLSLLDHQVSGQKLPEDGTMVSPFQTNLGQGKTDASPLCMITASKCSLKGFPPTIRSLCWSQGNEKSFAWAAEDAQKGLIAFNEVYRGVERGAVVDSDYKGRHGL